MLNGISIKKKKMEIFASLKKKIGWLQEENWNCSTLFLIHSSLWGSDILTIVTQQSKLKTTLSSIIGFVAILTVEAKQVISPLPQEYEVSFLTYNNHTIIYMKLKQCSVPARSLCRLFIISIIWLYFHFTDQQWVMTHVLSSQHCRHYVRKFSPVSWCPRSFLNNSH